MIRYGEFEIHALLVEGFPPYLSMIHQTCGIDVLPIEWEKLDLEVLNSFAINHKCPT